MLTRLFAWMLSPIVAGWHLANHRNVAKGALLYVKDLEDLQKTLNDLVESHVQDITVEAMAAYSKSIEELNDHEIGGLKSGLQEWMLETLAERLEAASEGYDERIEKVETALIKKGAK